MVRAIVVAFLVVVAAGCDQGSSGGVSPATSSMPAPAPVPVPDPAPAPAPDSATASATASAPASASASASAKPAPADAGKPTPACGDKPLPPCPLYAWMKANTSPAMSSQDYDGLAKALGKIVAFAPPGYSNWASIARDGADAARARSLDGVKASCRGCHNQYKDKYKKEMRDRPI